MHSDDDPVGRILSRRHVLTVFGLTGLAVTAAGAGVAQAATTESAGASANENNLGVNCVAKPEMTEGPYFLDEQLNRSDIRVEPSDGSVVAGTAFTLNLTVAQVGKTGCKPLPDATVDLWHCDAAGIYSGVAAQNTVGKQFLRGYQIANAAGKTSFVTVLPGWYTGRTIHFHVKIRTIGTDGNAYEFTSQLYLPEDFKAQYLATEPYAATGTPDTDNDADMHYADIGDQMLLSPISHGHGYAANFTIALDLSDTAVGADDAFTMGGGGGGPGGGGGEPPSGPPPTA